MAITYNRLFIDVNSDIDNIVTAKQGDANSRFLDVNLYDGAVPIDLTGHSVKIYFLKHDGTEVYTEGVITEPTNGRCQFEMTSQTLAAAGDMQTEITILDGGTEILSTHVFTISVLALIRDDDAPPSTNEYGVLVTLFQNIQNSLNLMNAIKTNFGEAGEKAAEYGAATFWRMLEVLAERTEEAVQYDVSGKIGENTDTGTATVFGKINNIGDAISEEIQPISIGLMIPKFTKAIITSGSFTIPKDGTYKIIACGAGGTSGKGGGGCAIDQRDFVEGDILTLTVSGSASAICSARSLSMTANGTTTATGATASGGNIANHTGGNSVATMSLRNSDGCGAGGYLSSTTTAYGGDGGVIGGDGYNGTSQSMYAYGGSGGIIGGNGGNGSDNKVGKIYGGDGGVFGGEGGSPTTGSGGGGAGGNGGFVGGEGGSPTTSGKGGAGGNGAVLGGNGGNGIDATTGGNGGDASLIRGEAASTTAGGKGAFTGMYWVIPYPEVVNWTKGNAIIFIEEV